MFLLTVHGCLLFSRGGRPWPFENCWLQFAHHNFGSQRPIFTSHPVMSQRPASPASLPKRGERQSSRLAEKSDDPLAEAATTAEIAVSQQAASNPQPTFSVNPSDISFSRIALGEAPSSAPSFSPGQIAHETESKLALLNQHLTKLFQQEKVKLAAYCHSDGILLDSSAILFTTWDKHPLTSQTDIFVSPPTPYQQAAPHGSPHLHVDASGNPSVIAFMGLFVELLPNSGTALVVACLVPVFFRLDCNWIADVPSTSRAISTPRACTFKPRLLLADMVAATCLLSRIPINCSNLRARVAV